MLLRNTINFRCDARTFVAGNSRRLAVLGGRLAFGTLLGPGIGSSGRHRGDGADLPILQAFPKTAAAATFQSGSFRSIKVGLPSHHWKQCLSLLIFQPSAVRRNEFSYQPYWV